MMFLAFMQCVCGILLLRIQDPVECVKHGVSKVASSPDYQTCGLDQHGSFIVNLRDRRALICFNWDLKSTFMGIGLFRSTRMPVELIMMLLQRAFRENCRSGIIGILYHTVPDQTRWLDRDGERLYQELLTETSFDQDMAKQYDNVHRSVKAR